MLLNIVPRLRLALLAGGLSALATVLGLGPAGAASLTTLYNFCTDPTTCPDGPDGLNPINGVIADGAGNLYGATFSNFGAVFRLAPDGNEKTLHQFNDVFGDGAYPHGELIADGSGNLFGVTAGGSGNDDGGGVVYTLRDNGKDYRLLHRFDLNHPRLGYEPIDSLVMDGSGNLYGTARLGGKKDNGTAFQLTPSGTYRVLHIFCSLPRCADGSRPQAGLIIDAAGNLYGTATAGGKLKGGTVFQLRPSGSTWAFSVLHSFPACTTPPCRDGNGPQARLVMDPAGNLYGTTFYGGETPGNDGIVFELTPNATGTKWTEAILDHPECFDGCGPLSIDGNGNLFGATTEGGANNLGSIFELKATGAGGKRALKVLYDFCQLANCADGALPMGSLLIDANGTLVGTTESGGAGANGAAGTVYALTP